jgi:hypothetical protein
MSPTPEQPTMPSNAPPPSADAVEEMAASLMSLGERTTGLRGAAFKCAATMLRDLQAEVGEWKEAAGLSNGIHFSQRCKIGGLESEASALRGEVERLKEQRDDALDSIDAEHLATAERDTLQAKLDRAMEALEEILAVPIGYSQPVAIAAWKAMRAAALSRLDSVAPDTKEPTRRPFCCPECDALTGHDHKPGCSKFQPKEPCSGCEGRGWVPCFDISGRLSTPCPKCQPTGDSLNTEGESVSSNQKHEEERDG